MHDRALATAHPTAAPVPSRSVPDALHRLGGVASISYLSASRSAMSHDELPPPTQMRSVQEVLPLDDLASPDPSTGTRPRLRLVSDDTTDLDRLAARLAQMIVEILGGERAAHHLLRWATTGVYSDLVKRAQLIRRQQDPRGRRLRAQVRSVHVSRPDPTCAEIAIHVRHGARSRAIAARIELEEGRWRCTAIEFG